MNEVTRAVSTHKVILGGLLSFLMASACAAQDDPCLRRTVPVSVRDSQGGPVLGLTPRDFEARVGGKPVAITSIRLDNHPHRVVVVLDSSGSMFSSELQWGTAVSLIKRILNVPPSRLHFGLIVFNREVRARVPIQESSEAARMAVEALPPWAKVVHGGGLIGGTTALWDAVMAAAEMLGIPEFGDSIYLVTDGGDNDSSKGSGRVLAALRAKEIRLYVEYMRFGTSLARLGADLHFGYNDLTEICDKTGGILAFVPPPVGEGSPDWAGKLESDTMSLRREKRMEVDADILYAAMENIYHLELSLPDRLSKAKPWQLVRGRTEHGEAMAIIDYPRFLNGCPSSGSAGH